ncbi:MAG: hypothetical protein ACRD1X_11210 [Vicinamibacteria bacterium]
MARWLLPAVVLGLLSDSTSFGQVEDPDYLSIKRLVPESSSERDDGLQETIHRVRQSFQNQQADQLEACFAARKVFISLRSKETEAGYYTRSQLHFIFDKVFRDLQTRSFNYSPSDVTVSRDGRAYFRSQWTYKVMGSDTTVTELLHFSLEKENDDWRIFELKSVSQ